MMNNNTQQGFTLLESLIAMFITAGALLGLGALHLKSVQQSQLAMQRTIANIQANDLVDRLWANRCSLPAKKDSIETAWKTRWDSTQAGTVASNQTAMHQILKGWQGNLTDIDTAKQRYQVVISWTNAKAASYRTSTDTTVTQQSFTYNFTLPKCAT